MLTQVLDCVKVSHLQSAHCTKHCIWSNDFVLFLLLVAWGSRDGLMGNKEELVGCFVHLRSVEITGKLF